ncbi:flagellar basal body-associated FliL family protein [Euzebya rosea]|uniref:flagellar basal body-associated FliL family protein n=1 Tax=Euzebya rosea TaxID=2052804 RepID=UPI00130055B1|nr:flagellar basal body-associated FliL family protein [Euzebya rosea]
MARKKKKDDAEATAAATADAPEAGGGKKKGGMLPAIIVAVAVLAGGAMAGGVIGGGSGAAAAAGPAPEPTPTPMVLGTVIEMDPITLNLVGEGSHFLKLGVAVELGPDTVEEPPSAPIYDVIIDLFGDYTYADLLGPDARDVTKEQLLTRLSEIYGESIVRVYYTEFVMQ